MTTPEETWVRRAMCSACRGGRPLGQWQERGPVGHPSPDGNRWVACSYEVGRMMTGPEVVAMVEHALRHRGAA
jgi:hypothetical protein